jgi:hypothetical protein
VAQVPSEMGPRFVPRGGGGDRRVSPQLTSLGMGSRGRPPATILPIFASPPKKLRLQAGQVRFRVQSWSRTSAENVIFHHRQGKSARPQQSHWIQVTGMSSQSPKHEEEKPKSQRWPLPLLTAV